MNASTSDFFIKTTVEIPTCSICLESCTEGLGAIACGHVFHHGCVDDWVQRKHRCPNCRTAMRDPKVLPLQFKLEGEAHQKRRRITPNSSATLSPATTPTKWPPSWYRHWAPDCKEQNCRLKLEKTDLFKRCQSAEDRASRADSEASAVRRQLSDQMLKIAELTTLLETAQNGLERVQQDNDQLKSKLAAADSENAQLKQGMRRMNKYKVVGSLTTAARAGRGPRRRELLRDATQEPLSARASRDHARKVLHQKGPLAALEGRLRLPPQAQPRPGEAHRGDAGQAQ